MYFPIPLELVHDIPALHCKIKRNFTPIWWQLNIHLLLMKNSGLTAIRLSIRICQFMKACTHAILILIPLQKSSFSNKLQHEIFNNVEYATSKASDQPAHMRRLIRAIASRLHIL